MEWWRLGGHSESFPKGNTRADKDKNWNSVLFQWSKCRGKDKGGSQPQWHNSKEWRIRITILMKIEKPYDATRVVALRRMVIDLETLDYILLFDLMS